MKRFLFTFAFALLCFTTQAQAPLPPLVQPYTVNVAGATNQGYIFTNTLDMSNFMSSRPTSLLIMDQNGELVFYMPLALTDQAPFQRVFGGNFELHVDGRMSFTDELNATPAFIYLMDSTFEITDTLTCTPQFDLDGHDFEISSDGHYHILATEERIMDASALTSELGPQGDTNCVVTGHVIQEFDENMNFVGEWKSLDHFALTDVYDEYYFLEPDQLRHTHINSLQVDHEGNYIISCRPLHEITRINRQTGDIMWRLGGKNNEFTIIGDTTPFTAQHDAELLPDGRLLLFDNATFSFPHRVARQLVYQIDDVNMTATLVSSVVHPGDIYSGFMGSVQQFDSGNDLVCWGGGYNYNDGQSFQEFDAAGNSVMDVDFEFGIAPYRATKFDLPWSLNRPEIICDEGSFTLSTPETYESYWWSSEDTTETLTVSTPGTYQLWVNKGAGFISSLPFEVTDMNDFCSTASLSEPKTASVRLYPVPSKEFVQVQLENAGSMQSIEVYDMQGRLLSTRSNEGGLSTVSLDVRNLESGMYKLRVVLSPGEYLYRTIQVQK